MHKYVPIDKIDKYVNDKLSILDDKNVQIFYFIFMSWYFSKTIFRVPTIDYITSTFIGKLVLITIAVTHHTKEFVRSFSITFIFLSLLKLISQI